MDLIEMLGMCASTRSLPAMKLRSFGCICSAKNIGIIDEYDTNKFCKNGKIKRKYLRRRRNVERRRFDFIETKQKLLTRRTIVLPKYMTKKKLWTQSLISSKIIENGGKCKRKKSIMCA